MNALFLFLNVATLVGLGPVLPAALFLLTALALCESLIRVAFASGTHFGYFLFESAFCFERPHFENEPSFFLEPISTLQIDRLRS
jgi:hypothetical protein